MFSPELGITAHNDYFSASGEAGAELLLVLFVLALLPRGFFVFVFVF